MRFFTLLCAVFLLLPLSAFSSVDSLPPFHFSSTNLVNADYEYIPSTSYGFRRSGRRLELGTAQSQQRYKLDMNVPFYRGNKWTVAANLKYKYEQFALEDVQVYQADSLCFHHGNHPGFHVFSGSLLVLYKDSFWQRPFLATASLLTDGSEYSYPERINASVLALSQLSSRPDCKFMLGFTATSVPTAIFPVLPVFTLDYILSPSSSLNLIFPQQGYYRQYFGRHNRLSAGIRYVGELCFLYPKQEGFPSVATFNRNEIREELFFQHDFGHGLVVGVRGGGINDFWCKGKKKNASSILIKSWSPWHAFVGASVSFTPQLSK